MKMRSTVFLYQERGEDGSGSFVFGNRRGVGCEGCYPDGAYHTCAVYLDFLTVNSGTASHQATGAFLETVFIPRHLGGYTALGFARSQWTS